jgi:hypothetical protein
MPAHQLIDACHQTSKSFTPVAHANWELLAVGGLPRGWQRDDVTAASDWKRGRERRRVRAAVISARRGRACPPVAGGRDERLDFRHLLRSSARSGQAARAARRSRGSGWLAADIEGGKISRLRRPEWRQKRPAFCVTASEGTRSGARRRHLRDQLPGRRGRPCRPRRNSSGPAGARRSSAAQCHQSRRWPVDWGLTSGAAALAA